MSIASRIEAIEQHLTDDYSVLTLAGADLTNVDKNILNLKPTWKERLLYFINNGTDVVWDNWDKVTGEGTSISLNNTLEGKMKIDLKGNTYQDSTTGINLFCPDGASTTRNGITVTNNGDGTFTINGTATNNVAISLTIGSRGKELIGSQAYTLAMDIISNGNSRGSVTCEIDKNGTTQYNFFSIAPAQETGMKVQVSTPSENATIKDIAYYVASGLKVSNLKIRLYLVKGSYTTSTIPPYEPYTNGASPNPDYPQDIHVVSGDNEIDVTGKNLFDKTLTTFNGYLANDGTETASANYKTSDYIQIEPNTSYATGIMTNSGSNPSRCYYDENKTFISGEKHFGATTVTGTSPSNAKYMRESIPVVDIDNVMIYKGSTATTYEPYQGSSYPINLGTIELCKIGTYQDKIFKNTPNTTDYDSNLEDNSWYLKKEIGKVVLNGTENWSYVNSSFRHGMTNLNTTGNDVIKQVSNYFQAVTYSSNWSNYDYFVCYTLDGNVVLKNKDITNINDFKTWLSTHNTTVYYVLATPTYTLIEDSTLIEELESMKKSYEGQTNISQNNNDLPFIINATALKEMA